MSAELKDDAVAVFMEYRNAVTALVGAAVLLVLLSGVLGGRLFGGLLFLGYGLVWLIVAGFVLWMLYRLVVAVERIAGAQERIASVQFQAELEEPTGTTGDENDDRPTFGDDISGDEY